MFKEIYILIAEKDNKMEDDMDKGKFYTNRRNIVLLATLCCILWGSAYPAIKGGYALFNIAENDIPSKLIFAGYRFALAGIVVLIVQIINKQNIFNRASNVIRILPDNSSIYIFLCRAFVYNRNQKFNN